MTTQYAIWSMTRGDKGLESLAPPEPIGSEVQEEKLITVVDIFGEFLFEYNCFHSY